jgi:hypothetical protein
MSWTTKRRLDVVARSPIRAPESPSCRVLVGGKDALVALAGTFRSQRPTKGTDALPDFD